MAEISNLQESWNGHSFPEVETFVKDQLGKSGLKLSVETSGNRFRVNLLDGQDLILSQTNYVSTSQSNALYFRFTEAVLSIKLGDKVYTEFFYLVTDSNGIDAQVPASVTVTVKFGTTIKGTVTKSITSNSTTKIDITEYIEQGETSIEAKVVTDNGEFNQTIYGRILAINLALSSRFDPKLRFTVGNNLSIPYSLVSTTGTKIIEWFVDKSETPSGSYTTTSNSVSATISIPTGQLPQGTHSVQIRAKFNNNGSYIYSNSICFLVSLAKDNYSERQTGFGSRFDYSDGLIFGPEDDIYVSAGLYSLFTLDYFVYDSANGQVNLYVGEDVASTGAANASLQYTTKLSTSGDHSVYVFTDRVLVYQFIIRVESAGVQIEEPANPAVILRALNKSNARVDRNLWEYNGKNYATFENFNWTSDGWLTDSLLIRGGAKLTLNIKPLESPTDYAPDLAMTIIFKIKVTTVLDLELAIISCMSSGYGIEITPLLAKMITSTSNTVSRQFAAGLEYEIGFVSYPADGGDNDKMLYLYINGIVTAGIRRSSAAVETIYQPTGLDITITGLYADVYLYSVSYYRRALSANEMVDLYLLNINDTTTFIDEYESNNVIDDGGAVTVSSIPDNIPYLILTGQSSDSLGTASTVRVAMRGLTSKPLPRYDIDEILFVNKQKPEKNFKILNGCIRLQGTTTLIYPVKNLRIYSKNSKKQKSQLWLGCDASGQGGILSDTHKYSFKDGADTASGMPSAPVSCFVLKADCSDSSSTHNVGMATFINKVFIDSGVKTPALKQLSKNKYDIRIAIDGFPCYVFYRETPEENPIFLGKFNMINDKGSGEVFGFEDIKGLNNKSDGFRNVGDFKLIRVDAELAYQNCSGLYEKGSWEALRQYAIDLFTTTYSNGLGFNNGNSEFDDNGEFVEYNDLGEHIYWDRYGFVYEDDSWAVFYDCSLDETTGKAIWTLDDDIEGETCHKHINPTESWEFATNLSNITAEDGSESLEVDNTVSSRVLFTTSEFETMKDGVAEWTNDFDLRYPDSDDLLEEYTSGKKKPRYLKAVCDWLAGIGDLRNMTNAEIKAATFKNQISNYFNLNNLTAYFCATQLAMGVDQMAKNMMLCFFYDAEAVEHPVMGKMRGYLQFYDNDTILGLRNDGYLIYSWDLAFDTWDSQQNQYAFAGYKSVLWGNLVYCFSDEILAMYQNLRSHFTLQDFLDSFTKLVADKYCERIVNIDMYNKYIEPLINEGKSYLMSLHGTRTSHRTWLINNRVDLFDARYFAGDYKNTIMMLRGGRTESDNKGNVTIVSQRDWYYAVEHESTISEIKFIPTGGTYLFTDRMTVNQSLSPLLYGLKYAKSLDLSDFIWNISQSKFEGTYDYLQEIIYSKYTDTHDFKSDGSYCNVGAHAPILKKFIACHQKAWGTLDISANNFIEEVDNRGSSGITSILFPDGDSLKILRLGSGLTTLTLENKPNIEIATIEGASEFRGDIKVKGVSNVAALMVLSLLNYRYRADHNPLGEFSLEMGSESSPVVVGLTNIQDLIKLALDSNIRTKSVKGYCKITTEMIYRYQYNLLKEAFPDLHIDCTPSPDNYRIAALNAEINECGLTSIYATGMNLAMLKFELGKIENNQFIAELDSPAYSGLVRIDETYPLKNRISIDNEGVITCDIPHENAAWTLDVYVHAYPYYYTAEERTADTYITAPDHFVKVVIKAIPVTGVTINLSLYISPNTIYKPTYTVSPSNNTKQTQGATHWSSADVPTIDANTGQFTSPTLGTIAIVLTYSMFGKTDGDSVKQTSTTAILNSAVISKTINADVFYAFRRGLKNAIAAGDFTAFGVYETTEYQEGTNIIKNEETLLFTATELLDITSKAFTYILKELADIGANHSLAFGSYLTNVVGLTISDSNCKFGAGLTDIVLPVQTIEYTCPEANLFKDCTDLASIELPNLQTVRINAAGAVTNELFRACGSTASNLYLNLPKLNSIQMTSTTSAGITNRMFYGANIVDVSLPALTTISCTNNDDSLHDEMFGNNLSLRTVSLPNLSNYIVGVGGDLKMFNDSSNVTELSIGNVGANANSVLQFSGNTGMTRYIFSNMEALRKFNTKILQLIPGIATFYGDMYLGIDTGYTLDWSGTKLNKITIGADKFFYKCERVRKWILPGTFSQCENTNSDSCFLFGSNVQIIDIRNRVDGAGWGDMFKGAVINNSDPSITTPVKLLFLHFNPNTMPTFSQLGTGLKGNYPVFIGPSEGTTVFENWRNASSGIGSFASIFDAASYNDLYLTYLRYQTAINNGMDESTAYNIYPCNWERSVTANRLFPYCMAKWMSRKIFMTSLLDNNSGIAWPTLNSEINTELGTAGIEYDLEDITGTMLNKYNFDTTYVDKVIISSYSTTALARVLNDVELTPGTSILKAQFPNYNISYNSGNQLWSIYDIEALTNLNSFSITRSQLSNSGIYNNTAVRKILDKFRRVDGDGNPYYGITTFDELQYFTSVSEITRGDSSDLTSSAMAITSITLPQGCSSIQAYGLCNTKLLKINNSYSVTTLGSYALASNPDMSNFDMLFTGLSNISSSSNIWNGTTLNSIEFNSLTDIGSDSLTGLTAKSFINNAAISSFSHTLTGCTLEDIQMPNCSSVTSQVFSACSTLKKINLGITGVFTTTVRDTIFTSVNLNTIEEYTFDKITKVGDNVFASNSKIKVFNSEGVTQIGNNAFSNTQISFNGENIVNSDTITSIGDGVFYGCSNIIKVLLPKCSTVGLTPFEDCSITEAALGLEGDLTGSKMDSIFTSENKEEIIKYTFKNITSLGENAFKNNSIVITIDAPEITSLGNYALYNCSALASIQFDKITQIGNYALYGTKFDSEDLIIPEVTSIGDYALANMTELTTVTEDNFPKLTSIGEGGFYNSSLTSCTLPKVTSCGKKAFEEAEDLASVKLSIESIPQECFKGCTSLTKITQSELNNVKSIGTNAFNLSGITLIDLGHIGLTFTSIAPNAFNGISSDCKVILRSNSSEYTGHLGYYTNTLPVKPMYVADQYELDYEDNLDTYYNRPLTNYPSYEQVDRLYDAPIDLTKETTSIESNLYNADDGGDDKIYTQFYPWNAKDREVEYTITQGEDLFELLQTSDGVVLIVPNADSTGSSTGKVLATLKDTDITSEIEFIIPQLNIVIEDSVVKRLLVAAYDANNDGRIRSHEITGVTSICSLSDERIKKVDLSAFTALTTIPNNTFKYNFNMTTCKLPSGVTTIGKAFEQCSDKLTLTLTSTLPPTVEDLGLYPEGIYVPSYEDYKELFKDYDYLLETSVEDTLKDNDDYNIRLDDGSAIKL